MINPLISPAGYIIEKGIEIAIKSLSKSAESGDIDEVSLEARKQQILAKVQQELAIAHRINTSYQVEIEEFYEGTGEGSLGLSAKEGNLNIGASGEGTKVTRRIYKFTGIREVSEDNLNDRTEEYDSQNDVNFILKND
jgi:hypothetical protein